jgi:hypothetical protein
MGFDTKLANFNNFENIRKNVAFHFTSKKNVQSILNEGLRPLIGDNSSGGLGQSAIEKTYISYGLEGVLQLYNRLVLASFQQNIGDFNGIAHKPFVPDSAKNKSSNENLSMLEGFEMIRQYMEDNVYFIFDAPQTQYEHDLSDSDLKNINSTISELKDSGTNVVERVHELNKRITELAHQNIPDNKDEILELVSERNRLAILAREKTLPMVNSIRGNVLNENQNPIMEEIDYNDERLIWINQMKKPHNTHTKIIENNGKLQGVRITKDMLQLFSQDNEKVANGLEFLNSALEQTTPADQLYIDSSEKPSCHDCNMLFKFHEYLELVEKYKSMGLMITKPETTYEIGNGKRIMPERQVMDLENISKYPGLSEFEEDLEKYYEDNRYKKPTRQLAEEAFEKIKNTEDEKTVESEMQKNENEYEKAISNELLENPGKI